MHKPALFCPTRLGLAVALLAISGCGRPDYPPVHGRVTLGGEPLADAVVSFLPVNEQEGTPTFGRTDSAGNYTLQQAADWAGAPAGDYVVRITTYSDANTSVDPPIPGVPEKVPAKYNVKSTLIAEVKPGENVFNFDLDSDGTIIQP